MALILNIETSTDICSVSLSKDGKEVSSKVTTEERSHAKLLSVLIKELLVEENITTKDLDAVAISKGPGSYTGLRIGVSTAKGICFGSDIPLIAMNTLKIMAFAISETLESNDNTLLCPMIDARRSEVYQSIFDVNLNVIDETSAKVIDETSYSEVLKDNKVYFFGNGAPKCKDLILNDNAQFLENGFPMAASMGHLAEIEFNKRSFEDIAYFEPFYLKEFVTTTPKKKFF